MTTWNWNRTAPAAAVLALIAAAGLPAPAQDAGKAGQVPSADRRFAMEAAQGGMAEVEMGRLAVQKAENAEVKTFGQRMIDDHGKANEQLKTIAGQKNLTLPADMGPKHKAAMDRLSKLSGAEFDRAYMRHMVADHKKDVASFQKEANGGQDPDLKGFASQTLPTLEEHLKMAQDIHSKLGGGAHGGQHNE